MLTNLSRLRAAAGSVLATAALFAFAATAQAGGDWNDAGIAWKGYDQGLAEAKTSGKPVCLIFFTTWCPHCTNYSQVFHDPAVVELSKKFVMIHLDKDQNTEASGKYAPDGEYIPRTIFLKSDGTFLSDVHAPRPSYKYFYDEHDPKSVMASMNAVLALPAK